MTAAEDYPYQTGGNEDQHNEMCKKIDELNMEIARHHKDFERWEEMADKGAQASAELKKIQSMSEHPELPNALPPPLSESDPVIRQELHTFMAQFMERTYHTTVLYDFGGQLADALLAPAGPVGKLQAELAEAQRKDDPTCWPECGECHIAYVHRYALHFTRGRVWVWQQDCKHGRKGTPQPAPRIVYADALAAGESAVTGEQAQP